MTKLGTWKRTVLAAATVAVPVVALFGGAALAESQGAAVPPQSVRLDAQRVDAPSAALPTTIRQEAATYRATGDECVGAVCAKGVTATTPAVEVSQVGGPVETPATEVATGTVTADVTLGDDSVQVAVAYGAIGVSHEVSPYELAPRH